MKAVRLSRGDLPDVVDVLCDAFRTYPVMRFVLDEEVPDPSRLRTLTHLFCSYRVHRDEPMWGVHVDGRLVATATVRLEDRTTPPEMDALRDATWAELGAEARARYAAYGKATAPFEVDEPNIHLSMIGVRRDHQRRGLSRVLLDAVHRYSESSENSCGVTLATEEAANVGFYEHVGYSQVGYARVAEGLETWGFYRRDEQDG